MIVDLILRMKIKYLEFIIRNDRTISKSDWGVNLDESIHLDAEDLAERGMKEAYERVLPQLSQHTGTPKKLVELELDNSDDYIIELGENRWVIVDENTRSSGDAWVNAAVAFFEVVNSQLIGSDVKFYAFYGSHDLSGMFLTQDEYDQASANLPNKMDWPYVPTKHEENNGRPL